MAGRSDWGIPTRYTPPTWNAESQPDTAARMAAWSERSPFTSWHSMARRCSALAGARTRATTPSPRWRSFLARWPPMNPVAPVMKARIALEQTHRAALVVDVHAQEGRFPAESWRQHDVASQRDDESGFHRGEDVPDGKAESPRPPLLDGVVREGQVGLGHADRQRTQATFRQDPDLPLRVGEELDAVGPIQELGDPLDLFPDGQARGVDGSEVVRPAARLHHGLRQLDGTRTTFLEPFVDHDLLGPDLHCQIPEQRQLRLGVCGETVDRHDAWDPEGLDDRHVGRQVVRSSLQGVGVLGGERRPFRHPPVCLDRSDGGHQDGRRRAEVTIPADDVAEL